MGARAGRLRRKVCLAPALPLDSRLPLPPPHSIMPLKILHRPLRLFLLLLALGACTATDAARAVKKISAPTPSKSKVLAAIAAIEKDPFGKQGTDARQTVSIFAINSDEINIEVSDLTAPWLDEAGKSAKEKDASYTLLDFYIAGYVKAQLNNEPPSNYPRGGWLFVIRAYNQLAAKTKISRPSIERLAALESNGWLAEYSQIVVREQTENAAAWNAKIPGKKKLTRDYLSPAQGLVSKGKYAEAHALYDAWLAQNPGDAEAHFDLGHALTLQAKAENDKNTAANLIKNARPHILMAAALGSKNSLLPELLQTTAPNHATGANTALSPPP